MNNLPLGSPLPEPGPERVLYLDRLHREFLRNLVESSVQWAPSDSPLTCRRVPEIEGKHGSFWHCISGGKGEEAYRIPESARCQRISWLRPMLEAFNELFPEPRGSTILWWISDREKSSQHRYVISLLDFSYVVIIDDHLERNFATLVTTIYIERDKRRKKLEREYHAFWKRYPDGKP